MNNNQAEESVPDHLKCIICYEIFNKPISLRCGHTFCKMCLESALKEKPVCPTCRVITLSDTSSMSENITIKN